MKIETKLEFHRATTEEQRTALRGSFTTPTARLAMVFAVSQMVESGATKEQLEGAKHYRELLLEISEALPNPSTFPEKKLAVLG